MLRNLRLAVPVLFSKKRFYNVKGIDFDGVDDFVTLGANAALDNIFDGGGSIGLTLTAQTTGGGTQGRFVESGTNKYIFWMAVTSGSTVKILFFIDFNSADGQWRTATFPITLGTQHDVVITYNADAAGNTPIIYVDGAAVAVTADSTPVGTRVSDAGSTRYIGNRAAADRGFDGVISNVFFANRILTADEVAAYSPDDLRTNSFYADVITWLRMGDGDTYPTLTDYKGVNNGTMTNMASDDIVDV